MTLELDEFTNVIDMKPHRISMYDCYQNAIISALEGIGENEDYLMLGTWGFRFAVDEAVHLGCGDSISTSDMKLIKNIILTKHEEENADCIFRAAQEELSKGMPLILYQETYYNPWSLLFNKEHVDHYFVVVGVDADAQRLLCIDNYASNDYQVLEKKQMEKGGLKEYLTIEKKSGETSSKKELLAYLYRQIDRKINQEITPFFYLQEFTDKEKLRQMIHKIDNLEVSEVMRKLARVRDMRKGFANDLLRFIDEPDLTAFGNRMLESSQLFARMVILAVKCKKIPAKEESFLEKMSDTAQKIHDLEEACILELHSYLKSYVFMEEI